jgi:hypothetical protein
MCHERLGVWGRIRCREQRVPQEELHFNTALKAMPPIQGAEKYGPTQNTGYQVQSTNTPNNTHT